MLRRMGSPSESGQFLIFLILRAPRDMVAGFQKLECRFKYVMLNCEDVYADNI